MQGEHDPAGHEQITLVTTDHDESDAAFLERMTTYLDGTLRRVSNSRVIIDLEESDGPAYEQRE